MKNGLICLFIVLLVFNVSVKAFAEHPNEGKVLVAQLTLEVEQNNLEIKQSEEKLKSLRFKKLSQYRCYLPILSIESGSEYTHSYDLKSISKSLYGK